MDTALYYRDSDGIVIASTTAPHEVNIDKELPGHGPGISALRLEVKPQSKKEKKMKVVNGSVIDVPDQDQIDKNNKRKKDKKDGRTTLKNLGLTDDQMDALLR